MRHLIYILLVLSCFNTYGSHLIGGEITYTYLEANSYQVNITLYRDCNDCKLGKDGGGPSTESCNNLKEAYIRTISTSCGNENIGSIKLTKTGFENITKICDTQESKCGNKGSYSYGIEAHYYQGTVDFNKYTKYRNCGFHIFFNISERSDEFSNLISKEDDVYNFAYINPWVENISSPRFDEHPQIIFPANKTAYINDFVSSSLKDSIAYKWGVPLKEHNTPLVYSDKFSHQNFVTTNCDGNTFPCASDPFQYPPTGIHLDHTSGNITFTPSNQNEISTRVIEVEQWRKANNSYYLASKVRRDVMVLVTTPTNNEAPQILSEETYFICENEPWEKTIKTLDRNPTSGLSSNDSVSLFIDHNIPHLEISNIATSIAPFSETKLSLTPSAENVGKHKLLLRARDNYCPDYGESIRVINLIVSEKPILDLKVEEQFCGNNRITLNGGNDATNIFTVYTDNLLLKKDTFSTKTGHFQVRDLKNIEVTLYYDDILGCKDTLITTRNNQGDIGVNPGRILESLEFCPGDSLIANLNHPQYEIEDVTWRFGDSIYVNETKTFKDVAATKLLRFKYHLIDGELKCLIEDSASVIVNDGPEIVLSPIQPICYSEKLDLNRLEVTPSTGKWLYQDKTIDNNVLEMIRIIPNIDTSLSLRYLVESTDYSCGSIAHISVPILAKPEMKLANSQICSEGGTYRLSNSIQRPFQYSNQNIYWQVLKNPAYLISTPYPSLDIASSGAGTFTAVATNTFNNGCFTRDTASIKVNSTLNLSYNEKGTICQSSDAINIADYFDINIEGGGWQIENDNDFYGDTYVPSSCSDFTFQYFYHKNGCHDQLEIPVKTICKPTFDINISEVICQDYEIIPLDQNFSWLLGKNEIVELTPRSLDIGNHPLAALKTEEGCLFDTTIKFNISAPLNFQFIDLPASLCEGEQLQITPQSANTNIKIKLKLCDFNQEITESYSYTPSSCDLAKKRVSIVGTSHSNGLCNSHIDSINIPFYSAPRVFSPEIQTNCEPYELDMKLYSVGNDNLDVRWTVTNGRTNRSGLTQHLKSKNKLAADRYDLIVNLKNQFGCSNTQSFDKLIRVSPKPEASFGMANTQKLNLSNRTVSLYNYTTIPEGQFDNDWYYTKGEIKTHFSNFDNPVYELPADTGIFKISLVSKSDQNCKDTATNQVLVVPDIIAFIPSAFTPNDKGPESNNDFRVLSAHAATYRIVIFNKWGEKVYQSHSISEAWDGTTNGQFCPNGIYVYSIQLTNHSGVEYNYKGTVNLIR